MLVRIIKQNYPFNLTLAQSLLLYLLELNKQILLSFIPILFPSRCTVLITKRMQQFYQISIPFDQRKSICFDLESEGGNTTNI